LRQGMFRPSRSHRRGKFAIIHDLRLLRQAPASADGGGTDVRTHRNRRHPGVFNKKLLSTAFQVRYQLVRHATYFRIDLHTRQTTRQPASRSFGLADKADQPIASLSGGLPGASCPRALDSQPRVPCSTNHDRTDPDALRMLWEVLSEAPRRRRDPAVDALQDEPSACATASLSSKGRLLTSTRRSLDQRTTSLSPRSKRRYPGVI